MAGVVRNPRRQGKSHVVFRDITDVDVNLYYYYMGILQKVDPFGWTKNDLSDYSFEAYNMAARSENGILTKDDISSSIMMIEGDRLGDKWRVSGESVDRIYEEIYPSQLIF